VYEYELAQALQEHSRQTTLEREARQSHNRAVHAAMTLLREAVNKGQLTEEGAYIAATTVHQAPMGCETVVQLVHMAIAAASQR